MTWGFPRALYMDNGGEMRGLLKMAPALAVMNDADARTIIHARPYRAAPSRSSPPSRGWTGW